ncbi:MAG TPA: carbamoyltransferase N-terminal domain-containing protein, partial [Pirellulales bacterium]|nr:carbamoyltransferase N-terminal domain-containing protein [Pirellulales bacterium]
MKLAYKGYRKMYTLGINAAFHDQAACLVKDGVVLSAAEEERFTHIKHGKRPVPFSTWELPFHAIEFCLRDADIRLVDVDHVAYSFDPYVLLGRQADAATISLPMQPAGHSTEETWQSPWDPLFLTSIVNAPGQLADGAPHHLRQRFVGACADGPYRWHYVKHHLAHAVSAFHPSPFERAAVMTLDGRGETATTSYGIGDGGELEILGQVNMPHSLGILYEQVTDYLGFLHSSDEYKVMALASFGKPRYRREFEDIVQVGASGQYTIALPQLEERLGPARVRGGPIEQRHYDIAHSLQVVLEDSVVKLSGWLHEVSKLDNLCLAGGVA